MRNKIFHTNGDRSAALRRRAGCDQALDGTVAAGRGELCSAIDELIALAPRHYANAAIEFII